MARWVIAGGLLLAAACIRSGEETAPPAAPVGAEPSVSIGLATGADAVTLGGAGELIVSDTAGGQVGVLPPGGALRAVPAGAGLSVLGLPTDLSVLPVPLTVTPAEPGSPVRVNGRDYHGVVLLLRDRTGLTVVNRLGLEQYLAGVVASEMGRRPPEDSMALRAQAVVSRTYALRNMGRWRAEGFDLMSSVADQAYGGGSGEYPGAVAAVDATRGEIVTYDGRPIDAFFFSTCGGRTAEGTEVFRGADRPYLHSISDVDASGQAYCRISPRFEWTERWTGAALEQILARTLPPVTGVGAGQVRDVRDVRVADRSASGRASRLAVALRDTEVNVDGPSIRQVLRSPSGEMLRSTVFTLVPSGGRRLVTLEADGRGMGHGVGMCQWGAVGRARAGYDYREILAAYYPGTAVDRVY